MQVIMQIILSVRSTEDCPCWKTVHVWWRRQQIFRLYQQRCSW